MGGELLSSPDKEEQEPFSISKYMNEQAPYYYSVGVSPELYWRGAPIFAHQMLKAHEIERKRRNQEMWLQGFYTDYSFRSALSSMFGEHEPYLDAPIPLTDEDKEEVEERKSRERYELMLSTMKAEAERNKKIQAESEKTDE